MTSGLKADQGADRSARRWLGLEARLLLSLLAVVLLALIFGSLASEMSEGDTLAWDQAVLLALRQPGDLAHPVGPTWVRRWLEDITALGGVSVLTIVTILVVGYLLAARKVALAAFVAASVIGGSAAGTLLKQFFSRARPDVVPHLVEVRSLSFPSAHALNSAIVYLTLAALLARTERNPIVKLYIIGAAAALVTLIGVSRVYLGVHYPSDVLAGWCAGATWAAACATVARYLQHRHKLERD